MPSTFAKTILHLLLSAALVLPIAPAALANEGGGPEPSAAGNCSGPIRAATLTLRKAKDNLKALKKSGAGKAQIDAAQAKVTAAEARLKTARDAC
jgi:hypothetical protein